MESVLEVPPEERPRERLLENGAAVLSDPEIVAVLLRTGVRGAPALHLARALLEEAGGLVGLSGMRVRQFRRRGVGPAKAACLLAAVELGRRLARAQLPDREPLQHPGAVARYLTLRYTRSDQEVMGALFLDARHRLLAEREFFRGTLTRAAVEPRAILKEGLLRDAAGLVLFHTHPSGDPAPSAEDLEFTRRMAEAGEVLGQRLLDHLILGLGGRWLSLKQRGGW